MNILCLLSLLRLPQCRTTVPSAGLDEKKRLHTPVGLEIKQNYLNSQFTKEDVQITNKVMKHALVNMINHQRNANYSHKVISLYTC